MILVFGAATASSCVCTWRTSRYDTPPSTNSTRMGRAARGGGWSAEIAPPKPKLLHPMSKIQSAQSTIVGWMARGIEGSGESVTCPGLSRAAPVRRASPSAWLSRCTPGRRLTGELLCAASAASAGTGLGAPDRSAPRGLPVLGATVAGGPVCQRLAAIDRMMMIK